MSFSFLKKNLRHIFWWKAILRELRILNCQVFYLRFSKAMTLSCSSFVYYSWKSLFLQNILKGLKDRLILQNTDLWHNITITPFWEGNLKRTSFLRRPPSSCFLQDNTCVGVLKARILKNICERLLLKMCSWNWEKLGFIHIRSFNFTLKKSVFNINRKCLFLFHDWFPTKFVFTYNISLVKWEINSKH